MNSGCNRTNREGGRFLSAGASMRVLIERSRVISLNGTLSVPFELEHRRHRHTGMVVVREGGCEADAEVIWDKEKPLLSAVGLRHICRRVIASAVGTATHCRFFCCPKRR
jgi:hypothetical protein